MTESTNVGRIEMESEGDGGMSVIVKIPSLTLRLADKETSVNEQWFASGKISSRDARVVEALLMQALEDVRNMGGLRKYPTHAGLQIPKEGE